MRIIVLFVCALVLAADLSAAEHDRVAVDREAGFGFRVPASCRFGKASQMVFAKAGGGYTLQKDKKGRTRMVPAKSKDACRIGGFNKEGTAAQLEKILRELAASAGGKGQQKQGEALTASEVDYYRDADRRPFVAADWAPKGVTGMELRNKSLRVLGYHLRGRIVGVLCQGAVDAAWVDTVCDSVELLAGEGGKQTWREARCAAGRVFAPDGSSHIAHSTARATSWDKAYACETEHYQIIGLCSAKAMQGYGESLELLYSKLNELLPAPAPTKVKFRVMLAKTQKEFAPNGGQQVGQTGGIREFQGFYNPATGAVTTFTDAVKGKVGNAHMRIFHECTHQYLGLVSGANWRIAPWLHEAFAVLNENINSRTRNWSVPRTRMVYLEQAYKQYKRTIRTFDIYFRGTPLGNVHQYAEVYALLHFILFGQEEGRDRMAAWWQACCDGQDPNKAWRTHILDPARRDGEDEAALLERWNKELQAYVAAKKTHRFPGPARRLLSTESEKRK